MRVTTIRYSGMVIEANFRAAGDPYWRIFDDCSWLYISWVVLGVNTRCSDDSKTKRRRVS